MAMQLNPSPHDRLNQLKNEDQLNRSGLATTPGHPFWVLDHGWKDAGELEVGDHLVNLRGESVVVEDIRRRPVPEAVYNFSVAGLHTYFVGQGGIWVHNNSGSGCGVGGNAGSGGGGGKFEQAELHLGDARTPVTHRGSADYEGPSHVYAIRSPDGSVYKVGKSSQGTRVGDGASVRAEEQVRELNRTVGPGHTSEIRKAFDSSGAALEYERRLRDRVRGRFGQDKLPGNRENY